VREETSTQVLCEFEGLVSLRHVYLGHFFLEPEDITNLSLEDKLKFSKVTGLP